MNDQMTWSRAFTFNGITYFITVIIMLLLTELYSGLDSITRTTEKDEGAGLCVCL